MKIKFLLTIVSASLFCLNFSLKAQNYVDFARTFSQREIGGTARMQGMGGGSSSLGGDISSTITNPAGLGFYNRSEASFSPSLGFYNSKSTYLGTSTEDYKTNLNFGSLGVVLNNTKEDIEPGKWRGGSFAISYSRIYDFHSQINYTGRNGADDFIGAQINEAEFSLNPNASNLYPEDYLPDYAYLAYNNYLIDPVFEDNNIVGFTSQVTEPTSEFPVQQTEIITTKGAGYSTNIAYGGNFADKFYIGASLGFTSIDYEIERTYTESPSSTILNSLVLQEKRKIDGAGFNLALGAIYRPISQLTIGLSYTTPTFYSLEDATVIDLVANFHDSVNTDGIDYLPYQFEFRSPARINTGVSYFIGKNGFITADVEFINYGGNKFSSNEDDFSFENDEINGSFNSVVNYKIGGEYRFNIFRARAGYAFFADPLDGNDGIDRSRQSFSVGAGIKLPNYYFDLAVVNTKYESSYVPYFAGPTAAIDNNFTRAILTFGFNF